MNLQVYVIAVYVAEISGIGAGTVSMYMASAAQVMNGRPGLAWSKPAELLASLSILMVFCSAIVLWLHG